MFFTKKNKKINSNKIETSPSENDWFSRGESETEGQLAIDVYQTAKKIFIISTIAGVNPDDLKISLHHDLLTIRGSRSSQEKLQDGDYLYRECYWGIFSRSIILPSEVDPKRVEAELENGVLVITLYKNNSDQVDIKIKD